MDIYIKYMKYIKDVVIKNKNFIKPSYLIKDDWTITHISINFTKRNVPFRHTIIIKPLYNNLNKISYLIGITDNNNLPDINILPILDDYDILISELEYLPYPIVLTTFFSPFIIKYVNREWSLLCGYSLDEAIGNTFSIIKGRSKECIDDTNNFRNEILSKL